MSDKVRTTITIDKNIYDQLDSMGVFKNREISMIINQLLLEYLKNYNINQLEINNKNFIECCIDTAITRSLAEQLRYLKGCYRTSAFSAEAINGLFSNNDKVLKLARENTRENIDKMLAGTNFLEAPLKAPSYLPPQELESDLNLEPHRESSSPYSSYDDDIYNIDIDDLDNQR